jgi:hypothetical protein
MKFTNEVLTGNNREMFKKGFYNLLGVRLKQIIRNECYRQNKSQINKY